MNRNYQIRAVFERIGNIDSAPLFLAPGIWSLSLQWLHGDYHLPNNSPALDTGKPSTPVGLEPDPNGDRINQGVYGGTIQAGTSS